MISTILNFLLIALLVTIVIFLTLVGMLYWLSRNEGK
jgi:hypothetical protein